MKRIEAMKPEETIDFIFGCKDRVCTDCPAEKYHFSNVCECMAKYLDEEVHMAARWETIKNDEDLTKMRDNFFHLCDSATNCEQCKYAQTGNVSSDCFAAYLLEKVPHIIEEKGDERT